MVVDIHRGHVQTGIGKVMQVVVGVFCMNREAIPRRERLAERALQEKIRIPLAVFVFKLTGFLAHESPRVAPFGVVEIDFRPPAPILDPAEKSVLDTQGPHIAVTPHGSGIITVRLDVRKLVTARRIEEFRVQGVGHPFAETLFVENRRIHGAERTALEREFEVMPPARPELRGTGLQVDGARRSVVFRRLHSGTLLPVVKRHGSHVVERILTQIDLSVLGIAQLHPVVEHAYMLCAHTTHIDRLQSPDTAVILDLHTGKITNGIGYGMDAQPLQLRAVEHLRRDDFFGTAAAEDDHRINPLYLGEPGGILLRIDSGCARPQAEGRTQHYGKYQSPNSFFTRIHCTISSC